MRWSIPSGETTFLLFSAFALPPCPGPPCLLQSPLRSWTRWKCPQMSPQLPAVLPWCRSGNYQRTSLTTAWGIRLSPVNVFILKKRCTFNRKPWVFFSLLLAFFLQKRKKRIKKKKNPSWKTERCSRVCVRLCVCVRCQPTVDSLLVRNRRSLPTLRPAGSQPGVGQGLCLQPLGVGGGREAPKGEASCKRGGGRQGPASVAGTGWDRTGGAAVWL